MRHVFSCITITLLTAVSFVRPSSAAFHVTVINEFMTSYNNDPSVQFIDMRMVAGFQIAVMNSVLVAFDAAGENPTDILVIPSNLTHNTAADSHWLVATAGFQAVSGVAPDFVMPSGKLPSGGGMLCFGGGGGAFPAGPSSWSRTAFNTYVDCVAYGNYTGPSNAKIGTPTQLTADGHSLLRTKTSAPPNDATDFVCSDDITSQNNTGTMGTLAASLPCETGATTPTATPTPPAATATAPVTPPTPSGTLAPPHPCTGDCNGDGAVTVSELIVAVNIVLGNADRNSCPAFGAELTLTISDLITAVNSVLNGCPATPTPLIV